MVVKLLRLKSGEDIVGEVIRENEELITISNPAILMPVSQSPGRQDQIQIGLAPWIPFSEETEFKLPRDWVLLTTTPVQDIVNNVGTSQSNISQHLAILRDKGILSARKSANKVFYKVSDLKTLKLIEMMREVFCPHHK